MGSTVRGVSRPRAWQSGDIFYFSLQLDLRGNAEGIVDLDAEVVDSAFEFDVSRSELNPLRFPVFFVDLRRPRSPHRVRRAVKSGTPDPGIDDPSILSRRKMRLLPEAAREEVLATPRRDPGKPVLDRCSCLFCDFDSELPRRQAEHVCRVYVRGAGAGKVLQRSRSRAHQPEERQPDL